LIPSNKWNGISISTQHMERGKRRRREIYQVQPVSGGLVNMVAVGESCRFVQNWDWIIAHYEYLTMSPCPVNFDRLADKSPAVWPWTVLSPIFGHRQHPLIILQYLPSVSFHHAQGPIDFQKPNGAPPTSRSPNWSRKISGAASGGFACKRRRLPWTNITTANECSWSIGLFATVIIPGRTSHEILE
jgi:hypothetical protein